MDFQLHQEFPLELEDAWNRLLEEGVSHLPFLRFDYLYDWWSTRGGGEWADDSRLAIITAHDNDRLVGIAPFFIPEGEETRKLILLGSIEISDFLDVICREEDLNAFISGLLGFVKDQLVSALKVSHLEFYNLLENSLTVTTLEKNARALGLDVESQRLQHSPYIPLPEDWDSYLANLDKKQRHEIRRKLRKVTEGDYPASLYLSSDELDLEDDMEDFFDLMAQDEEKEDFLSPRMREQLKNIMRCAFKNNCLQLSFLEIGEKKAAAYLSFDFLNRIWVYNSGVDREFLAYSPGWVLLAMLLQKAIEMRRSEFDFMRGDEDYKYRFGAIDRFIVRVSIQL